MTRSHLVFWEHLVFTEASLGSTDETKELVEPIATEIEKFDEIQRDDLGSRRRVIRSKASCSMADSKLNDEMRRTQSTMLHEVNQNRRSKSYKILFSDDIGSMTKYALKRQLEVTKELVSKFELPGIPDSIRTEHKHNLEEAILRGEKALKTREEAQINRLEQKIKMDEWKDNVNAIRLSVYSMLLQIASKTNRKASWANSFFAKVSKSKKHSEDTTPVDLTPDS